MADLRIDMEENKLQISADSSNLSSCEGTEDEREDSGEDSEVDEEEDDVDDDEIDDEEGDEEGDDEIEDDLEDENVSEDDEDEEEDEDGDEDLVEEESQSVLDQESESDGEDLPVCPICLDKLRAQDIGTPESCDHQFCLECIIEWSRNINTCPVDRQPFNLIFGRHPGEQKIFKRMKVETQEREPDIPEEEEDSTSCEVCHGSDREDRLLLCDGCDLAYHCECLTPPLGSVPVEEWFCPTCADINAQVTEQAVAAEEDDPLYTLPRRQIARTRVSERVRQRIQNMRLQHRRPPQLDSSEDEEIQAEVAISPASSQQSFSASRSDSTTLNRKKTARRKTTRKRKTTRRRKTTKKRKSPKKKSSSTTGKTSTKKKTLRRKRKTRRRKKRTTKRKSSSVSLPGRPGFSLTARAFSSPLSKTIKGRIAERLGLSKPPPGRTIPLQRKPAERVVDLKRGDLAVTPLSILGNRDELIAFQDVEEDTPQFLPAARDSSTVVLPRGRLSINRPVKKIIKVSQIHPPASSFNLLDSIFEAQTVLHMRSSHIEIKPDGTLNVSKAVKVAGNERKSVTPSYVKDLVSIERSSRNDQNAFSEQSDVGDSPSKSSGEAKDSGGSDDGSGSSSNGDKNNDNGGGDQSQDSGGSNSGGGDESSAPGGEGSAGGGGDDPGGSGEGGHGGDREYGEGEGNADDNDNDDDDDDSSRKEKQSSKGEEDAEGQDTNDDQEVKESQDQIGETERTENFGNEEDREFHSLTEQEGGEQDMEMDEEEDDDQTSLLEHSNSITYPPEQGKDKTEKAQSEAAEEEGDRGPLPQEVTTPFSLASFLSHVADKITEDQPSTSQNGERKRHREERDDDDDKEFTYVNGMFARVNKRKVDVRELDRRLDALFQQRREEIGLLRMYGLDDRRGRRDSEGDRQRHDSEGDRQRGGDDRQGSGRDSDKEDKSRDGRRQRSRSKDREQERQTSRSDDKSRSQESTRRSRSPKEDRDRDKSRRGRDDERGHRDRDRDRSQRDRDRSSGRDRERDRDRDRDRRDRSPRDDRDRRDRDSGRETYGGRDRDSGRARDRDAGRVRERGRDQNSEEDPASKPGWRFAGDRFDRDRDKDRDRGGKDRFGRTLQAGFDVEVAMKKDTVNVDEPGPKQEAKGWDEEEKVDFQRLQQQQQQMKQEPEPQPKREFFPGQFQQPPPSMMGVPPPGLPFGQFPPPPFSMGMYNQPGVPPPPPLPPAGHPQGSTSFQPWMGQAAPKTSHPPPSGLMTDYSQPPPNLSVSAALNILNNSNGLETIKQSLALLAGSNSNTPPSGSPVSSKGALQQQGFGSEYMGVPPPPAPTSFEGGSGDDAMDLDAPTSDSDDFKNKVIEEVKNAIRPHFNSRQITKDQYKEILKKCVPKVEASGEINTKKISSLVAAYVKKYRGGPAK